MIRRVLRRAKNGVKRRVKNALQTAGLRSPEPAAAPSSPLQSTAAPVDAPAAAPVDAPVEAAPLEVPAEDLVPEPDPMLADVNTSEPDVSTDGGDVLASAEASSAPKADTDASAAQPETAPAEDVVGDALTYDQVLALIDSDVRPALQMDGGDIELVKVESNDVYVRLLGACSTCPSSTVTMRMGIERLLQEEFPHMGDLIQLDSYEL